MSSGVSSKARPCGWLRRARSAPKANAKSGHRHLSRGATTASPNAASQRPSESQRPSQFGFRLGEFLDEGRILHQRCCERGGGEAAGLDVAREMDAEDNAIVAEL